MGAARKPKLRTAPLEQKDHVPLFDLSRAPGWRVAKVSFKRKLEAIYKTIGQPSTDKETREFIAKGLGCYAQNQAEDEVIARLSKGASKHFGRATGRPIGVGVGPAL